MKIINNYQTGGVNIRNGNENEAAAAAGGEVAEEES